MFLRIDEAILTINGYEISSITGDDSRFSHQLIVVTTQSFNYQSVYCERCMRIRVFIMVNFYLKSPVISSTLRIIKTNIGMSLSVVAITIPLISGPHFSKSCSANFAKMLDRNLYHYFIPSPPMYLQNVGRCRG
jgi:hypothetical protein